VPPSADTLPEETASGRADAATRERSSSNAAPRREPSAPAELPLIAWRCSSCGRTSFPPRSRCSYCWSEDGAEVELPAEGEVHSFTTIHVGRPGTTVPYTVAYVDVDGVRLFARLEGESRIGARGRVHALAPAGEPPRFVVEVEASGPDAAGEPDARDGEEATRDG
jgi:uncharacterized OB-fold protein